ELVRHLPADRWPAYTLGSRRLNQAIAAGPRYPISTVGRLRHERAQSTEERLAVKRYNYNARYSRREKIRRYAAVEFMVDTTGRVFSPKVRPGYDADLAAPVLATVQQLRAWKPARYAQLVPGKAGGALQLQWRLKPAMGIVEVGVTPAGAILISSTWDEAATRLLLERQQAEKQKARYQAKLAARVARRDSILRNGGKLSAADLAAPTAEGLFYELGNIGLGWANCDRFIDSPQPLVRFAVQASARNAQIMLVFSELRCVVSGQEGTNAASTVFQHLPSGAKVTIVAIRWEQGKALLAAAPATIAALTYAEPLQYRPITMLELQQALASL
ncbi:hypothetical protein, partial [Hymenobacter agri]